MILAAALERHSDELACGVLRAVARREHARDIVVGQVIRQAVAAKHDYIAVVNVVDNADVGREIRLLGENSEVAGQALRIGNAAHVILRDLPRINDRLSVGVIKADLVKHAL